MSAPFDDMLSALSLVYGDAATLADPRTAHLVVDGNAIVGRQAVPGVEWRADERDGRLVVELAIAPGATLEAPVHTCIGFLGPRGSQAIDVRMRVGARASATVLAHCLFPNAEAGTHAMRAAIDVGASADLRYLEGHYHGTMGGMTVFPRVEVQLAPDARYSSAFSLSEGRVGRLRIEQRVVAGEQAVAEIVARISGRGSDDIHVRDELTLSGRASRGLIKTRIALADDARAEVVGVTRGLAAGARGHMDCLELVRDRARARAEPVVEVEHPLAKVTHEAAVGTVDQDQLETLMARGLTPEQAIELIVTGMLR